MSSPDLRTDIPHSARIYDYLLGGKDNFAADRQAAAGIVKDWPNLPVSMPTGASCGAWCVTLAAERGIRQFPDIGAGVAAYNVRGMTEEARTRQAVEQLFQGLDLIDAGVTLVNHWRPDERASTVPDAHVHMYGGAAVKH